MLVEKCRLTTNPGPPIPEPLPLPLPLPMQIDIFVQEVMDIVELTPLTFSVVGFPGRSGLSNEQRKRLTIAVELVANPSVVFMDEPTSGTALGCLGFVGNHMHDVVGHHQACCHRHESQAFSVSVSWCLGSGSQGHSLKARCVS